jgi:two-component system chemotaxis response regulator CheY
MSNALPTILIVDDSATTRAMIKRVIGMTGLPVGQLREAGNGQEGLAVLESSSIDLVLADLNMPVMDGMEMIRRMRRDDRLRLTPVIVISAQPDDRLIAQLKRDGVVAYLPKPFTAESVRDVISPLLDKHAATSAVSGEPDVAASLNLQLAEALAEALETMAFVSPQLPTGELQPCPLGDLRLVRVAFHDSRRAGSFALAIPHQFGVLMAENCCAPDDPAAAEAGAEDALKELANVACGLLLRKRLCGSAGFEMSPPILSPVEEMAKFCVGSDVVSLDADGFLITAHVTADSSSLEPEGAVHGH